MSALSAEDRAVVRRIVDRVHRVPAAEAALYARIAELEAQLRAARKAEAFVALECGTLERERAEAMSALTRSRLQVYNLRRSRNTHASNAKAAREEMAAANRDARAARRALDREAADHGQTKRQLRLARKRIRALERKDTAS